MNIKYINLLISTCIILCFSVSASYTETAGGFISAVKRYTRALRLDDKSPIKSFIIKKRATFETPMHEKAGKKTYAPEKDITEKKLTEEKNKERTAKVEYLLKQGDKKYRKKNYSEAFELYAEANRMMD